MLEAEIQQAQFLQVSTTSGDSSCPLCTRQDLNIAIQARLGHALITSVKRRVEYLGMIDEELMDFFFSRS